MLVSAGIILHEKYRRVKEINYKSADVSEIHLSVSADEDVR